MFKFCKIILCLVLSITFIKARPHEQLQAEEDYEYDADLPNQKDKSIEEDAAVEAKQYLRNLLNKRNLLPTTTQADEKSIETTAAKTTITTTREPTTTSLRTEPPKAAGSMSYVGDNVGDEAIALQGFQSTSIFPVVVYPTPIFQQPTLSYFPVAYYTVKSTGINDVKPTTRYGLQKPVFASPAISSISTVPQFAKSLLEGFSGFSLMPAYNTYTRHMMTPVYNPNHFFN